MPRNPGTDLPDKTEQDKRPALVDSLIDARICAAPHPKPCGVRHARGQQSILSAVGDTAGHLGVKPGAELAAAGAPDVLGVERAPGALGKVRRELIPRTEPRASILTGTASCGVAHTGEQGVVALRASGASARDTGRRADVLLAGAEHEARGPAQHHAG